uniref:MAP/microtubule affinity-regulating kinase 4 n=1 Tax=Schistosoma haematobium TaxID=6185 RepID=A0A095AS61_SCHHA
MKMHHNISRLSMDKSKNLNHSIKSFNDSFKQTYNQHLWIDNTKSQMNSNGKYKIIRTIGQGNFAKVKLAIHLLTGRETMIKLSFIILFINDWMRNCILGGRFRIFFGLRL